MRPAAVLHLPTSQVQKPRKRLARTSVRPDFSSHGTPLVVNYPSGVALIPVWDSCACGPPADTPSMAVDLAGHAQSGSHGARIGVVSSQYGGRPGAAAVRL